MIELMLGAMVVSLWAMTIPGVVADAVTTLRAAKAGEWGLIDKQRDRKDAKSKARREAVSKAWQATRARRNKQAGGDGTYRPGLGAYLSDVYHGLWEDQLEKRHAKRNARDPYGPDGRRPTVDRLDAAVERKVQARRQKTGLAGRAWHALIDPVGEGLLPPPGSPVAVNEPVADAPRTACPVCGDTLTERDGSWTHPPESTCLAARRPDGGYSVPWRVKLAAGDLYRHNRAEGRSGALGETQTARDLHGMFGDQYPPHVYEQAAADATQQPAPPEGWMPQHAEITQAARTALNNINPEGRWQPRDIAAVEAQVRRQFPRIHPEAITELVAVAADSPHRNAVDGRPGECVRCRSRVQANAKHCDHCKEALRSLSNAVGAAWFQIAPDGCYDDRYNLAVCELVQNNGSGWTPEEIQSEVNAAWRVQRNRTDLARKNAIADKNGTTETSNGGTAMDTIDLVSYNQAVAEHENALTKLRAQQAEAAAFEQHITAVAAAVEAMDGNRSDVTNALAPLAEGMEASRFGADATQGAAEATTTLTAGTIAEVQEYIEAARDRNRQWQAELSTSAEGVQASLQHIKAQYGELAAGVQETGIDVRALEDR
ncbi:hypothetical protein [Verrucosispora sp. TAA-831]|uniref:hypothetical protein n=1 Tax=Verrucosispora sp. TAA-831 TaxID=3422227 RepID=UPI003D6F8650